MDQDKKKKLNLAIGGGILAIGGFLAFTMSQQPTQQVAASGAEPQMQQQQAPQQYLDVVVAKKDIAKGTLVLEDMVKLKAMPSQSVTPDDMTGLDQVVGKVATVDIVVSERVSRGRVQVKPSEMKLSLKVPEGKRAVTIPIDKLASLESMIKPGDRVDIIGTFPFQNKQPVVVPMFEEVLILAVGRVMAEYAVQGDYDSITMALSQKESTLLLFATQLGKLNLLLRSPLDTQKSRVKEAVTMETLMATLFNVSVQQQQEKAQADQQAAQPQQAPVKPAEAPIEVYSGGSKN